jgi:hypothetical protein
MRWKGSVAVEGEFRRLVHYVDDLVDGRRAIRDDWGGWSTSTRVCDCRVLPRALRGWLCPHQGCVLGRLFARGARRGVYTAAPSRMTAVKGSFTRLREASV